MIGEALRSIYITEKTAFERIVFATESSMYKVIPSGFGSIDCFDSEEYEELQWETSLLAEIIFRKLLRRKYIVSDARSDGECLLVKLSTGDFIQVWKNYIASTELIAYDDIQIIHDRDVNKDLLEWFEEMQQL